MLLGFSLSHAFAQTTLNAGDVMITGFNANDASMAFVTWVDLQPGTIIHFTNNGWNSAQPSTAAGNARNMEEIATWTNTSGGTVTAGTVIETKAIAPYPTSIGTLSVFSNAGVATPDLLLQDGDQITIYQATTGNGYSANNSAYVNFTGKVISMTNWLYDYMTWGIIDDERTFLPSDLADVNIHLDTPFLNPYLHYIGSRTGSPIAGYKALILLPANWQNQWVVPLNTTAFAVSGPLPVKLLQFGVVAKQATVELNWLTAQEVNLHKYEVEYSSNAQTFTKVAEIAATNQSSEQAYRLVHTPATAAQHYYRLKMIDIDETFTYSQVQKVQTAMQVRTMLIKPNPVVGQRLTITVAELAKNNYTLQLSNASGIVVHRQLVNHTGGGFTHALQLPGLPAGLYHIQLAAGDVKLLNTVMVK